MNLNLENDLKTAIERLVEDRLGQAETQELILAETQKQIAINVRRIFDRQMELNNTRNGVFGTWANDLRRDFLAEVASIVTEELRKLRSTPLYKEKIEKAVRETMKVWDKQFPNAIFNRLLEQLRIETNSMFTTIMNNSYVAQYESEVRLRTDDKKENT